MKQIYHFDCTHPPVVSEKMLRAELERRTIERQTAVLALAGILAHMCLIFTAIVLRPFNAMLSLICIAYVCVAISGSGAIAIVFDHKRRDLI
ncbi:hypothetical protein OXPF_34110 [Oxobacter pfennigii]|uniref:Uncharacterized protein n=1 Tax=Oxobacter pfennigii TaxID=36849 RepID=A0A0P8W5N7_9CLOT|nr:hypothetical protein [Oxobacter pfennigii]KPU42980.1 hypothetical protein OXPF_34110 [Oxobacter pfennigii]